MGGGSARSRSVRVTGTVQSETGVPLAGDHVVFNNHETREWTRVEIKQNGRFEGELPREGKYDLVFFHQPIGDPIRPDFDGVPVIYDLETTDISTGAADVGAFTVPKGYRTMIRIVDGNDNPLRNVPLSFYVPSGAGTGPGTFTTNGNGYVKHVGAPEPGIELVDRVVVRVQPPGGDGGTTLGRASVDEQKETTFTLRNPEKYTDVVVGTGSETPTSESQSNVTASGRIVSASNDAVANNVVHLLETRSEETFQATTDANGEFQLDIPGSAEYLVAYFQSPGRQVVPDRPDNIPAVYFVKSISVGSGPKDLGTIKLPRAHRVEARVVDENGRPVEDAGIQIRSGGFGLPPRTFTTNEDGYVKHSGADDSGVDLAGPVRISAWPPGERREGRPTAVEQVVVDEEQSITITLGSGGDGGTVRAGSTDGSNGDGRDERQRGFFSNSGNEPGFLSNPFNLTTLGFLLSVAGIIHQLMGGR